MTEKKLTKKEMFLVYAVYIGIIAFVVIFFREISNFLKLTPVALHFVWDLAPYLGLAVFFLGTLCFGLKRGFMIILMCSLITIPIVISYYYINELKPSKPEILFVSYLILISSFVFAGECYQKDIERSKFKDVMRKVAKKY
ncbi:hypothetical protein FZ731_08225 [Campylobacter coli]|nr:hypothetical protein [Campylobacter coli]ECQ6706470.1 hypothetical protein [Campylobacter coli]EFB0367783.1 hypothetical protein [Campylobacter coli]HEH4700118.1 hypothetical protein [Campylobacter coli]